MSFNCFRCLKEFKRKDYLNKHYERKYPCKPVDAKHKLNIAKHKLNILREQTKHKLNILGEQTKHKLNISKNCDNSYISNTKSNNIPLKPYKCNYCNKTYKHYQSKYRHQKNCKNHQKTKKKEEKIEKIIKKLEENNKSLILANKDNQEILKIRNNNKIKDTDIILSNFEITEEDLLISRVEGGRENTVSNQSATIQTGNTTNLGNTTNSCNTTNSNNTIIINNHINPFGKENLESISEDTIIKILNTRFNSFQTAMKTIHKDIPENCNFFLPNKSDRKFITYYNGKECVYETTTKFKDKLSDKIMGQLETWFEKYNSKFIKRQKTILKNVFNEYYDGNLEERYNTEIDKFLLSHSNEIRKIITTTLQTIDD